MRVWDLAIACLTSQLLDRFWILQRMCLLPLGSPLIVLISISTWKAELCKCHQRKSQHWVLSIRKSYLLPIKARSILNTKPRPWPLTKKRWHRQKFWMWKWKTPISLTLKIRLFWSRVKLKLVMRLKMMTRSSTKKIKRRLRYKLWAQ